MFGIISYHLKRVYDPSINGYHNYNKALVPFHLANTIKSSRHLILDISDQALLDVQANISNSSTEKCIDSSNRIEYEVANVLESPLPYASDSFDVWIDKGLLDALFCGGGNTNIADEEEEG